MTRTTMIPAATITSRSTSNGRLVIAFLVVVVVVVCVLPFPLVNFLVSFIIIVRANPVVIDWLDGESIVGVRILIVIPLVASRSRADLSSTNPLLLLVFDWIIIVIT